MPGRAPRRNKMDGLPFEKVLRIILRARFLMPRVREKWNGRGEFHY
ncbi:hypothetical protein FMM74_015355 [Lachnospiraceae bacterium MD308]|nr:hypothetical protein [Lachnospiraceae bacterium MD308]